MKSSTEVLRRLLDERGVEWTEGIARPELTQVRIDGKVVKFHQWQPNTLKVSLFDITPEQAIAVTLGRSECHDKNGFDSDTGFECTVCGTMVDSYMVTTEDTGHYTQFNFCPNCGRKVVDE